MPIPPDAAQLAAVWESIERLQRSAGRLEEQLGQELGLTDMTATALAAVADGARTVSAVAEACGRHVSTASRIVDGLVERQLVRREEDPADRRAVRLTLTPQGASAAERVLELNHELLAESLAELDPRDVDELARILSAFAAAVERRLRAWS